MHASQIKTAIMGLIRQLQSRRVDRSDLAIARSRYQLLQVFTMDQEGAQYMNFMCAFVIDQMPHMSSINTI